MQICVCTQSNIFVFAVLMAGDFTNGERPYGCLCMLVIFTHNYTDIKLEIRSQQQRQ